MLHLIETRTIIIPFSYFSQVCGWHSETDNIYIKMKIEDSENKKN